MATTRGTFTKEKSENFKSTPSLVTAIEACFQGMASAILKKGWDVKMVYEVSEAGAVTARMYVEGHQLYIQEFGSRGRKLGEHQETDQILWFMTREKNV